jgi:hypothetical protein
MFMSNGSFLVHPDSIAEMRKVVSGVVPYEKPNSNTPSPNLPNFGLIWHWRKLRNRQQYIGHGGAIFGATHSMLINEQGTVGTIILTNTDVYPDNDSSIKIRATLDDIQMSLFACFEA